MNNIRTIRASSALLALVTLMTLLLAGCSVSGQGGATQETDAQKAKRLAIIQQHKDATDNGH